MNTRNIQMASNKMRDIERYFYSTLCDLYPEGEIRQFIRMLAEAFLGWDNTQYLLYRNEAINQSDLLKFHWAVEDLKNYRPIQHIIGYSDFCDCRIKVNERVLIPRPETEEIVLRTMDLASKRIKKILDICTGSGCIAISLAKHFTEACVDAIEISTDAIELAKLNASSNNVKVNFLQRDAVKESLPEETFDLIISNPPYVMDKEQSEMRKNVLDYEPHLALFVTDEDPLLFYRTISKYAVSHLTNNGLLVFEINEKLSEETVNLVHEIGFSVELFQDFRGKDRMLVCRLSN